MKLSALHLAVRAQVRDGEAASLKNGTASERAALAAWQRRVAAAGGASQIGPRSGALIWT
jgi:hypothetical protein